MRVRNHKLFLMVSILLLGSVVMAACWASGNTSAPAGESSQALSTSTALPDALASSVQSLPLQKGNQWVYRVTFYSTGITTTLLVTDTIVETTESSGYAVAKVRREEKVKSVLGIPKTGNGGTNSASGRGTSEYYWWVVSGKKAYRQKNHLDLSHLDEALIELEFPLKVGDEWYLTEERARFGTSSPDGSMLRRVVEDGEVSVPAGRFGRCSLLRDEWGDATQYAWFCPGVGFVKRTVKAHGPEEGRIQELVRYRLRQ